MFSPNTFLKLSFEEVLLVTKMLYLIVLLYLDNVNRYLLYSNFVLFPSSNLSKQMSKNVQSSPLICIHF